MKTLQKQQKQNLKKQFSKWRTTNLRELTEFPSHSICNFYIENDLLQLYQNILQNEKETAKTMKQAIIRFI